MGVDPNMAWERCTLAGNTKKSMNYEVGWFVGWRETNHIERRRASAVEGYSNPGRFATDRGGLRGRGNRGRGTARP